MRYLLDTCVIAELCRRDVNPVVRATLDSLPPEDIFLSTVSLGELWRAAKKQNGGWKGRQLEQDLDKLAGWFGERVLPVDVGVARVWGKLNAQYRQIPALDALLAATALAHGLTLATRRVRDFRQLPLELLDPWVDAK